MEKQIVTAKEFAETVDKAMKELMGAVSAVKHGRHNTADRKLLEAVLALENLRVRRI